jgi:hypothetical protein
MKGTIVSNKTHWCIEFTEDELDVLDFCVEASADCAKEDIDRRVYSGDELKIARRHYRDAQSILRKVRAAISTAHLEAARTLLTESSKLRLVTKD